MDVDNRCLRSLADRRRSRAKNIRCCDGEDIEDKSLSIDSIRDSTSGSGVEEAESIGKIGATMTPATPTTPKVGIWL
jgi:hypothetical protein